MNELHIERVEVRVVELPLPEPESDATLQWDRTTGVVVTLHAGGESGVGWTYSSSAAASVVTAELERVVVGRPVLDVGAGWEAMHRHCRNIGTAGLVMQAMSAVDIAWWDLKGHLMGRSLADLVGAQRDAIRIYGSGGFTSLTDAQLASQIEHWHELGCTAMKIKIGQSWGACIERDLQRTRLLARLAGDGVELMVDANGGYTRGQARRAGNALDDLGVGWFEEPVSSDDTAGLGVLAQTLSCDVAAGEYAADLVQVTQLLPVVDCLQLDVTRCGGYTGWLRGAAAAQAAKLDVSGHCAPALHAAVAVAIPNFRHLEYFADHERFEHTFVEGLPEVRDGALHIDRGRPGHGMSVKLPD